MAGLDGEVWTGGVVMGRMLRPGPGSMRGLEWLVRVGPAPLGVWRCAMGWSEVAARSHARRLEGEGWLCRYPMKRGEGSLFVATRRGVGMTDLPVTAAGADGDVVGAPVGNRMGRCLTDHARTGDPGTSRGARRPVVDGQAAMARPHVNGHLFLPIRGHLFSPLAAMISPH
jgi:hypothetical protein